MGQVRKWRQVRDLPLPVSEEENNETRTKIKGGNRSNVYDYLALL